MKMVPLAEARENLGELVADIADDPVIITHEGKPRAALVALTGEDLEAFILAHTPRFLRRLDEAVEEAKSGGTAFAEIEAEVLARPRRRPRG